MIELVSLPDAFVSDAGEIQNITGLDQAAGGVAVLRCRAGSVRSNHYHRTDAHVLYVVSGQMLYRQRRVGAGDVREEVATLRAGDAVYTPPMMAHRTEFPVETVLLSLSRRSRDHESHEEDVVRVDYWG